MAIENNPFYLLKVSCSAGRGKIISASDEMSFMLNAEVCSSAQNELINLNKRLSAEINWFIDIDEDIVNSIRSSIENGEPISTDGLLSLSKLNATIYNFSLQNDADPFELGYSILDIDEQFSCLDANIITEAVNQNRNAAKLGLAQTKDVQTELGKKREEIRQTINEKLSCLDQDTYIELVTTLAEKCIIDDRFNDGVIISDVIDQYEVRMQSALEESTNEIEKHIERIKALASADAVSSNIDLLIYRVEKWDVLAQPLQLKSQASGMPHDISEKLGLELRDLAVYLHNEKGLTKEALNLVNAMKGVFAELGVLLDKFESDSDALNDLLKDQKFAEEIVAGLKSLQEDAESIKYYPTLWKINSFIDRIKKLNRRLKEIDLGAETKIKVRMNLCYMARDTAIELHNTKHQTSYALTLAKELANEFGDLPNLRERLNRDVAALSQQVLQSVTNEMEHRNSSSSSLGCATIGYVILGIIFIVGLIFAIGKLSCEPSYYTSKTSSDTDKSSSYSQSSNSSSSSASTIVSIYTVLLNQYGGTGGVTSVTVKTGSSMPNAVAPTRAGYDFKGYYSALNGEGIQYYDANMKSVHSWDKTSGGTLYAYWEKKAEEQFSSSASAGDIVYTDIVSIFPEVGIYTQGSLNYTGFVCRCKTSFGSTVWVYMTCTDYINAFDSSASTSIYNEYAEEVSFSSPRRIHGTAKLAETIVTGLSIDIMESMVIELSSIS